MLQSRAIPPPALAALEASAQQVGANTTALDTALAGNLQATVEVQDIPTKDPTLVSDWWASLSPAEQQNLIQHHGDTLGNLNGLPSDLRNQINRARIGPVITSLQSQISMQQRLTPPGWQDKVNALNDQLQGLQTIESKATADPNFYILAFDTNGSGHYAVSYGDPDTAAHVVAYVPGTGSSLGPDPGNDIQRAQTLRNAAEGYDMNASTASIVWLGYDAPPGIGNDIPPGAENRAEAGAIPLDSFVNGLQTTHQGAPANTTLIGHSYGSTVVGYALKNHTASVNNAIFVGSPGIPVQNASQLSAGHVWAGDITNDPVPILSAPLDPTKWFDDSSVRFGVDPTSSDFGATVFDAGTTADPGTHDHSQYWATDGPNGVSLHNMAHIVAGQPNQVTLAPNTTLGGQIAGQVGDLHLQDLNPLNGIKNWVENPLWP